MPALVSLQVADDPQRWTELGFTVEGGRVRIGTTDLVLTGRPDAGEGGAAGLVGWTLGGAGPAVTGPAVTGPAVTGPAVTGPAVTGPAVVEGLATTWATDADVGPSGPTHANGTTSIDHLVVSTPDLERSVAAFEGLAMVCRRRHDGAAYGSQKMRQAFFWLGDDDAPGRVVLEVVGPAEADPSKSHEPARFFGLALVSTDLDVTCAFFGDLMKPPTEAVQAGRRITTLSSRAGCAVALAFMSAHV